LDNIDWKSMLRQASAHGVLALIASTLRDGSLTSATGEYAEFLEEYPRRVRAKNKFFTQELVRIQDWLAASGIPSLTFKGPALAIVGYGGLDKRTCVDLDVLIPEDAAEDARMVLAEYGYQGTAPLGGAIGRRISHYFSRQQALFRGGRVFQVDVHTAIVSPFFSYNLPFDELERRARQINIEGFKTTAVDPTDLLLTCCHQGLKNRWRLLKHMVDVAVLVPFMDGRWSELFDRVERLGAERTLLLGLYLAREVLDVSLPDEAERRIAQTRAVSRLGDWAVSKLDLWPDVTTETLGERMHLYGRIHDTIGGTARYTSLSMVRKLWYGVEQLLKAH
jgi:hypothetical protein